MKLHIDGDLYFMEVSCKEISKSVDTQSVKCVVDIPDLLFEIVFIGPLRPLSYHVVNRWADVLPLKVV